MVSGASAQVSNEALEEESGLQRSLSNRHMQMIAIGGAIGTGLFVASGATVSTAGPGGALVAYTAIGLMVLLLMQSLGEMTAHMPVAGSFQTYATRFVSPSFGFAMGWNYWFNWAITVAAELVAAGIVMAYWLPGVPSWIWAALFLALLTTLNALSARAFGEGEFWLSAIKVVTVIVFLVAGVAMIAGIIGGRPAGFGNWTTGDAPFHGGMLAIVSVFMVAGFSFQGTELVGVAAGEARNPRRDVPKAIHTVFWRIMIFYIGAITVIGFLIAFNDSRLLHTETEDVAYSPFTLVFERAGIGIAAALMNAVILTAVLSAGNSGLYASTRMLHSMALQGQAPAWFSYVNRHGGPWGRRRWWGRPASSPPWWGRTPPTPGWSTSPPCAGSSCGWGSPRATSASDAPTCSRAMTRPTCPTRRPGSRWGRSWPSPCAPWWSWARTTRRSSRASCWRCSPPTSACRSSGPSGWGTAW